MTRTLVVPRIGPQSDPDGANLAALPVARALMTRPPLDGELVLVSVLDLPAAAADSGETRVLDPTDALPAAPCNASVLETATHRSDPDEIAEAARERDARVSFGK